MFGVHNTMVNYERVRKSLGWDNAIHISLLSFTAATSLYVILKHILFFVVCWIWLKHIQRFVASRSSSFIIEKDFWNSCFIFQV